MKRRQSIEAASKGLCLVLALCLAGCQQMQGSRVPLKPGRNNNDPFLGSPLSRIPPTQVPTVAKDSQITNPGYGWNGDATRASWVSVGDHQSPGGAASDFQPVAWANRSGKNTSWEEVFRQLRARGVTWQRLEMQGNQWRFECSAPHPTKPGETREYFATAPDPLSAIQAVLNKLDGGVREQ